MAHNNAAQLSFSTERIIDSLVGSLLHNGIGGDVSGVLKNQILQRIIDAFPIGIWITDASGKMLLINKSAEAMWDGKAPKARTIEEYEKYQAWWREAGGKLASNEMPIAQALRGRTVHETVIDICRFDGTKGSHLVSVTPIRDQDRTIVGTIAIVQDLTKREQQFQVKTQENEQLYKKLFENTNDAFQLVKPICDKTGKVVNVRILRVNDSYETQVGIKASAVEGSLFTEIDPHIEQNWIDIHGMVAKTGKSTRTEIYNDYTKRWFDLYLFPYGKGLVGVLFRDITKQKEDEEALRESEINLRASKKAEKALRESEERFRTLLETSPIGIAVSSEGMLLYTNPTYEHILGYERGELIGVKASDLYLKPPERNIWLNAMNQEGIVNDFQTCLKKKDGSPIWVSIDTSPISYEGKQAIMGTIQDISERKRVENELRESEAKFRTLADNIPNLVWMANADGWIFWYNKQWFKYTGTTFEEMQGWGWQKVHHPDYLQAVTEEWKERIRKGQPYDNIFPLRSKNGEYHWFLTRVTPIKDKNGIIQRWFGTNTDITERKEAEDAVQRQAQLIDLAPDAFIVKKKDGTINFWSKGSERLYGWSSKEAIGQNVDTLLKTKLPKPAEDIYGTLIETGTWSGEIIHTSRNGRRITVLSHWLAQRERRGAISEILESNIDITERKQFEVELLQKKEEVETANKELESFSYAVSHDLRAPLRAMDGFSQALLEDYSACIDTQGQDYLHRVRDGARRMDDLIDAILRLSRQTRKPLLCERIDFHQMADSIIEHLHTEFPERKVEAIIGHCHAFCDRELCYTALDNLIRNAWKFTKKKQDARIEINCFMQNGETVYFVRDNGAGFDMKYADKLFVPFQRLHDSREFPGIGIGLSTVKHIVQKHGGRIWAEGEVGKGATFYFTLPE